MDEKGNLFVLGRIRDVFKTSKGVFVAPDPIEEEILKSSLVSQACVLGLGLPQPIALVNVAPNEMDQSTLGSALAAHAVEVNRRLSSHERISNIIVCRDLWTEDNKMLTPTLKTRRTAIYDHYGDRLNAWQQSGKPVIFE
jgi:long-chain acyl-CoA synthetase